MATVTQTGLSPFPLAVTLEPISRTRSRSTPTRRVSPLESGIAAQRRRAVSTCSDHLAAPVGQAEPQCAINRLVKEAESTRVELRRRGFDFEVKFGDHGVDCVVRSGHFVLGKHAGLLLRHAMAHGACGHDGLADAVWRFLAEELGADIPGVGLLSDIEHLLEHKPEAFAACQEIGRALTDSNIEPCRTHIATMAKNLRQRMENIPLEQRTSKQALALLQAKLLLDGSFSRSTAERLAKLQPQIDILPEEAQVARIELFREGIDFEILHISSELQCILRQGRLITTEHANLLLRYLIAVEGSDHSELARPVWQLLIAAIGVTVPVGEMASGIAAFIECRPLEFSSDHRLKALLKNLEHGPMRDQVATAVSKLVRWLVRIQNKSPTQASAWRQASLTLGNFTDLFNELFRNDCSAACSVAHALVTCQHEHADNATQSAILLATGDAISCLFTAHVTMQKSTGELHRIHRATQPLLPQLGDEIRRLVEPLFNPRLDAYSNQGELMDALLDIEKHFTAKPVAESDTELMRVIQRQWNDRLHRRF